MANEENKEKIVETALQMFNERGCRGVTMDDIAQTLHMSKRTLYETFANKEELLTECLTLVQERTNARHRQAHSQVDEPLLVAMYMLRTNAMFIHKYRRIIEETERYYPEIHDRFFKVHSDRLRALLLHGMDYVRSHNYLRPDADVEVAIDFFCNLIQQQRSSDVSDRDEYARRINEMCFTYLRGLMTTDTLIRYDREVNHFAEVIQKLDADNVF
jgi:AcrR family transcriptional regulator